MLLINFEINLLNHLNYHMTLNQFLNLNLLKLFHL